MKDTGILEKFDLGLEEARNMVMSARVALGWIDPEELGPDVQEEAEEV